MPDYISPNLLFVGKAGAKPSEALHGTPPSWLNILDYGGSDKHSSLLQCILNYSHKTFIVKALWGNFMPC